MHQPVTETNIKAYQPPPGFFTKWRRRLINLAIFAFIAWLLAVAFVWYSQEKLLFHPDPATPNHKFDLTNTSEVYIDVPGAKLHALYLRQPEEQSRGIILFLHGNAGNLETWFTHADFWLETGYDVLMPDYRGFGKSTGKILSEEQLNDDVLRVWNFVAPNYHGKKQVIYGRSLGTGLAATLASEISTDLLILVSPYTSMTDVAHEYYPWVPGGILRYPLKTDQVLPQLRNKILMLHGTDDKLISIEHSRRLQKLNSAAQLIEIDEAGHSDIHEFPSYVTALKEALASLSTKQ
ncbi:MAG: alpha/beta fold hydrolase [Gammaproteobacteria bacterium]|nr:MAG: alpha/beta fold hydrolase [Gammaproteobacteria bacterium]